MYRIALAAALALVAAQPALAADKAKAAAGKEKAAACMPANAAEAQEGLRYMAELGIATNACTSVEVYASFRTRNRDAILEYQKTMIAHLHGNAAYDKWNTSLANSLAQRQSGVTPRQFCDQSVALIEQAKTLDPPKYRAYAVAQAAASQVAKCK